MQNQDIVILKEYSILNITDRRELAYLLILRVEKVEFCIRK